MSAPLEKLPAEVLYNVFLFLSPSSVLRLQQVSQSFNGTSQPLLWRHYCQTIYKYWSPERNMQEKFCGDLNQVDWKRVFSDRHELAYRVTQDIDDILSEQRNRLAKAERIVANGYDTKDALLQNLEIGEDAKDVLARRYYSSAVLGLLHRGMAIREWIKLSQGEPIPLERALAGFDMFVLHHDKGDFVETSTLLGKIAEDFRQVFPEHAAMKIRRKAVAVAEYLREKNLVGIKGDMNEQYHNLQNNFLGVALRDPDHPSLPLISATIYCCVAQRVGLNAHPCGFPFHVLAIIESPGDLTTEGDFASEEELQMPMYIDPFHSSVELTVEELKSRLVSFGIRPSEHSVYLSSSSTAEIVRRSAKNILNSVQTTPSRNRGSSVPDMENAYYASLWALTILASDEGGAALPQRDQFLPFIIQRVEAFFTLDVSLIESLAPFLDLAQQTVVLENARAMRQRDGSMGEVVKARMPGQADGVRFKVGQIFQHRRYNYLAVITGWDVECRAGEEWVSRMQVNQLARGQHQSFYAVKVEDGSPRYVAEDNIKIVVQTPSQELMTMAGQYFKRWDEEARKFVSNIRDEYPND